jgi:hypothetical protein
VTQVFSRPYPDSYYLPFHCKRFWYYHHKSFSDKTSVGCHNFDKF